MTPSLQQIIREEANKSYDIKSGSNFFENDLLYHLVRTESDNYATKALFREGYVAGAEAMAEKMEGFAEWIDSGPYYLKYENVWCSIHDHELSITTSELLTKYFDHLKEKEGK